MKKIISIALAGGAIALAGCGSSITATHTSTGPTQAQKTAANAAAAHAKAIAAQKKAVADLKRIELQYSYHNMKLLASDLKTEVNKKLTTEGEDARLNSMVCIAMGGQRAECNGTYSDGEAESVGVTISADGQRYITDGN